MCTRWHLLVLVRSRLVACRWQPRVVSLDLTMRAVHPPIQENVTWSALPASFCDRHWSVRSISVPLYSLQMVESCCWQCQAFTHRDYAVELDVRHHSSASPAIDIERETLGSRHWKHRSTTKLGKLGTAVTKIRAAPVIIVVLSTASGALAPNA